MHKLAEELLSNPVIEDYDDAGRAAEPARIGVVTFPGSLDDRDAARAVRIAGAESVALWHGDDDLKSVDAVVLPGGFSYGDYLRCGAIARFAPVMDTLVDAAKGGLPVLGICNGFQILCESHLLPGALTRNDSLHFICRDQRLRIEDTHVDLDLRLRGGPGDRHPAEERRGRLRRRRAHARQARGRGPRRRPLPRASTPTAPPRHRRHPQRARQRRRPDAAPRARRRGPHRPGHRRARASSPPSSTSLVDACA